MPRARNIKPGFFSNDDLAQCEYGARLVFVGLWTLADRSGRLEDRPLRIKGQLFPYDNCDVEPWLAKLAALGFITRYEVGGCKYLQVNNFEKHQTPHCREPESTIPAPGAHCASTVFAPECSISTISNQQSGIRNPESAISNPESAKELARKKFAKPSLEEVAAYCKERGNSVDPKRWMNHYEANGWMVGRTKMQDWQAAVRTWEANNFPSRARGSPGDPRGNLAVVEQYLEGLEHGGEPGLF